MLLSVNKEEEGDEWNMKTKKIMKIHRSEEKKQKRLGMIDNALDACQEL